MESPNYQVNDDSFNFETWTLYSDHIVTKIQYLITEKRLSLSTVLNI